MLRFVARRLLLVVPTLFGISLLTFLLLNLTPGSMLGAIDGTGSSVSLAKAHERAEKELGMRDPVSGAIRPVTARYFEWLTRAARFEFVQRGGDEAAFRRRIARALPPTLLVNGLAIWLAAVLGIALGTRLGLRVGTRLDSFSGFWLALFGAVPEMLSATLLVLFLGGGLGLALVPVGGLGSPGSEAWSTWRRAVDLVGHLSLPVLVVTLPTLAVVARLVREAVARALGSAHAKAAVGFGATREELIGLARRAGFVPLATVLPLFAATSVAGSFVVEQVFAIEGMGMLAWQAFAERDQPMVMALTLVVSLVTLTGFMVSDLLHAWLDPRVRLS